MLHFSRAVLGLVLNLTLIAYANHAVFLALALVGIHYLGVDLFGALQYFTAVAAFPAVFYGHYAYTITRFVPTVPEPRKKAELFVGTTATSFAILAAVFVAGAGVSYWVPSVRFWHVPHGLDADQARLLVAFVVLLVPVFLLQNLLQAYLAAVQAITVSQAMGMAGNVANLIALFAIWSLVADRSWGLVLLLGARLACRLGVVVACALYLGRTTPLWAEVRHLSPRDWPALCRRVHHDYARTYTLPLQFSSLFAYVKEHLAVLLLGHQATLSAVAYYDVARKLYEVPRKFLPDMVRTILPRIVEAMETDAVVFRRQFRQLAWLQLGFSALVAFALFGLHPWILRLFDVDATPAVAWVFFFFSASLLVSAPAQTSGYIVQLGRDTTPMMWSSVVRNLVLTGLTFALVPLWGAPGAAFALFASSVLNTILLAYATRGSDLWTGAESLAQGAIIGALCVALLLAGRRAAYLPAPAGPPPAPPARNGVP